VLKAREGLGKMATVTHTGGGEALRALLTNTVQLSSGAFETYTSLMAPVKTPSETVAWLEREVLKVLQRPDMRSKLAESGFEVQAKDGKTHMARVAKEVPMYGQIIASAGIAKR
jgi:tripartite-type tricarboxylate transporter receptor subunit TctC